MPIPSVPYYDGYNLFFVCLNSLTPYVRRRFGLLVYSYVTLHLERYAFYLAAALTVFIFSLYLLDFSYWDSKMGKILRKIYWAIFITGNMLLCLFLSGEYPYMPICVFAVITPLWLNLVKQLVYTEKDARVFVSWLSGPLFFISLLTFFVWLTWTFLDDLNEWNEVTRLALAEQTGCDANFEDFPNCTAIESEEVCYELWYSSVEPPTIIFPPGCDETCVGVYDDCINPFILWVGPLLMSICTFFLSFFSTFLRTGT